MEGRIPKGITEEKHFVVVIKYPQGDYAVSNIDGVEKHLRDVEGREKVGIKDIAYFQRNSRMGATRLAVDISKYLEERQSFTTKTLTKEELEQFRETL